MRIQASIGSAPRRAGVNVQRFTPATAARSSSRKPDERSSTISSGNPLRETRTLSRTIPSSPSYLAEAGYAGSGVAR